MAPPLSLIFFLSEDEGGVFLLRDVDVVAGVAGRHDVARSGIQQDAFVIFSLHADHAHTVPTNKQPAVKRFKHILYVLNSV